MHTSKQPGAMVKNLWPARELISSYSTAVARGYCKETKSTFLVRGRSASKYKNRKTFVISGSKFLVKAHPFSLQMWQSNTANNSETATDIMDVRVVLWEASVENWNDIFGVGPLSLYPDAGGEKNMGRSEQAASGK